MECVAILVKPPTANGGNPSLLTLTVDTSDTTMQNDELHSQNHIGETEPY
jgi:hypothetical protein